MPNKEPGAIRQLFAFVGERNSKMRISHSSCCVRGNVWYRTIPNGWRCWRMNSTAVQLPYSRVLFFSGIAAICQLIKMPSHMAIFSYVSHKISFTILKKYP